VARGLKGDSCESTQKQQGPCASHDDEPFRRSDRALPTAQSLSPALRHTTTMTISITRHPRLAAQGHTSTAVPPACGGRWKTVLSRTAARRGDPQLMSCPRSASPAGGLRRLAAYVLRLAPLRCWPRRRIAAAPITAAATRATLHVEASPAAEHRLHPGAGPWDTSLTAVPGGQKYSVVNLSPSCR
jgi:hypothetical protein